MCHIYPLWPIGSLFFLIYHRGIARLARLENRDINDKLERYH